MTRVSDLLRALGTVRSQYGAGSSRRKVELLGTLSGARLARAMQVREFHNHALFVAAFPDDQAARDAALASLKTIAAHVARLKPEERSRLDDSGIVGSVSRHTYEMPIVRHLAERFPRDVEIEWSSMDNSAGVDFLLTLVARRAEQEGLEFDRLTTRAWARTARGRAPTDLAWLLRELDAHDLPSVALSALYDYVELPVIWRLRSAGASVTDQRAVANLLRRRSAGLRPPPADPVRWISRKLPATRRLDRDAAAGMIDLTRRALSARCREVYAVTHGNPEEVYLCDLGRGVELAVIGVEPARRLSLEANYGYLLMANGLPMGYGGVTPLYRQANTGINIFESFRGAEAAFVWAQMLRSFRTLFGVTRFVVNPYQFGAGNSEALQSGAFWFYDRLGFRSTSANLRHVADMERERIRTDRRHRTDTATLRRLATADIELILPGHRPVDKFDEAWLAALSLKSSRELAGAHQASRALAEAAVGRRVSRTLGDAASASRTPAASAAFRALAPLVSLLDVEKLPGARRRALRALMYAKGAPQERDFVLRAASNPDFYPGLMRLVTA